MLPHWPGHAAHSQLKHTYQIGKDAYSMCKTDDAYWGNARCNHGSIALMRIGSRPTKCSHMDIKRWIFNNSKTEATLL